MAYRIKQIVPSGLESGGGYNYVAAQVDAAADFAAMTAFQDGSVGFIRGDPDTLYVKQAGAWAKMGKSPLPSGHRLELDGIDPYTLLMANKLFPRRAELEAVDAAVDAAALDIIALEANVAQLSSNAAAIHQYIIRWDKSSSQCTRMGDAAAITTAITNFRHSGSINASYSNPFDSLYPWKYRKLCKVNRAAYAALTPGSPITDAVTKWEGEPGYALDGSGDFDVVYTPEFWGRVWEDATYVYAGVADGAIPGWQHFEATIGGRYFGSLDGSNKMTSLAGTIPWHGPTMAALHANAEAQELTIDDIFTWCADTLLLCVEFATLNSQAAIGKGCSELFLQTLKVGEAAAAGATMLKLPNALVSACVAGAVLDLGTTDGAVDLGWTRFVSSADLEAEDPLLATHKAVTVTAIPQGVTADTYCALHGCYNAPDAMIGNAAITGYVRNYTKVRLEMGPRAGAYGSTITNIYIVGGGYQVWAATALLGPFGTPGDITFTAVITDSRGRSATRQVSITVLDYTSPTFSTAIAFRCNAAGAANSAGAYILLKATPVVYGLGGQNTSVFDGRIYMSGGTPGAFTAMSSNVNKILGGALLYTKSYIAEIRMGNSWSSRQM